MQLQFLRFSDLILHKYFVGWYLMEATLPEKFDEFPRQMDQMVMATTQPGFQTLPPGSSLFPFGPPFKAPKHNLQRGLARSPPLV